MTTYALLHGGWHGGWHWHRLADALSDRGHRAVTPDLPIDQPAAGGREYARVVVEELAKLDRPGDVVVVGHAMGGLTVPLVASARRVRRMVFLAAMFPTVGLSAADSIPGTALTDWFRGQTAKLEVFDDGSTRWPTDVGAETFFGEFEATEATEMSAHLRRQYYRVWKEVCPLKSWPRVPSTYIVCADDAVLDPNWSRQVARDALGVEAVEIKAGHEASLSRSDELAGLLDSLDGSHLTRRFPA
jgi:pimeloyl-ACP methyl ester carboxylesterase